MPVVAIASIGLSTATAIAQLLTLAVALLLCGLAWAMRHITQLRRTMQQALTDPVTNLPVRRVAEDAIAGTSPTVALTVVLADVDRLHDINNTAGHAAGDRCLADVAARLRRAATEGDTVARLGGDEFVLISRHDPADVAERLSKAFLPAGSDGGAQPATVSIGICQLPGGDPHRLLGCADLAMFTAKRRRSGIEFYDPIRDGTPAPAGVRPAIRRRNRSRVSPTPPR